jgi:epoxyqueuosine reductase
MLTYIQKALAEQGHTAAMVSLDILEKLQEDLKSLKNKEELNDFQNRLIEERYEWQLPEVDFEIRSILIVGKKNTMTQLKFKYKGKEIPVIMPPGYNEYFTAPDSMEHFLKQLLAEKGYKCKTTPMLPNKLLAVRSGFAKYGRNNIVYIDGMGSFCQIYLYYTDIPVEKYPFSEELIMKKCTTCGACAKVCPTGAIMEDRFLLDCKRCLTFLNETGGYPFPDWVEPKVHHALYGCNRCQEICPVNREQFKKPMEEVLFNELETGILLQGGSIDDFPNRLKNEIKRLNIEGYLSAVPRNLHAIFDQYFTKPFPQPILDLPRADIPLQGIEAYLSQGDKHQIIFMTFHEDVYLEEHAHEAQWGIVLEGKIELTVDGIKHSYTKGDRYFIPKDVKHSGKIYAGYTDMTFFNQKDRYREIRE